MSDLRTKYLFELILTSMDLFSYTLVRVKGDVGGGCYIQALVKHEENGTYLCFLESIFHVDEPRKQKEKKLCIFIF